MMDDLISRAVAINALDEQIELCNKALGSFDISTKDEYAIKVERASLKAYREQLENLQSAQPEDWMGRNKERILQAGMEGREIEFRIGGRLFAIREKAQ